MNNLKMKAYYSTKSYPNKVYHYIIVYNWYCFQLINMAFISLINTYVSIYTLIMDKRVESDINARFEQLPSSHKQWFVQMCIRSILCESILSGQGKTPLRYFCLGKSLNGKTYIGRTRKNHSIWSKRKRYLLNKMANPHHLTDQMIGRFIQKYPIYIIKCVCDTWSSYDISLYLEMLDGFYDYQNIKTMIIGATNQFLDQAGLAREKVDVDPKPKRRKVDKKTRKETVDPYVAHSVASSHSHVSEIIQEEKPQLQQQPEYLTWWDPNKQTMFYIDPITGNRYVLEARIISCSSNLYGSPSFLSPSQIPKPVLALPPPPASDISCQSSSSRHSNIDRSHLKTTNTQSKLALDLLFKNDTLWPPKSPFFETSYKLSKQDLQNATLLDQIDKKFIALQLNSPNKILIMIDQHAADERIKLEEMISTGIQSTAILEPSIAIDIDSSTEYQTLKNDERILKCLKKWGIQIQLVQHDDTTTAARVTTLSQSRYFDTSEESPHFQKSKIFVTHIPQLITERCVADHSLLKSIILDHMYWVMEQTDEFAITNTCPRGILEILKSRACRSIYIYKHYCYSTYQKHCSNGATTSCRCYYVQWRADCWSMLSYCKEIVAVHFSISVCSRKVV